MRHQLTSRAKMKTQSTILVFFVLQVPLMAQLIPYPDALDSASIVQSSIDNLDTEAMMVGNGDINALIYS
jgi:hypothetical protein